MSVEVVTIPRVYLKPKSLRNSAFHTAYIVPGQNPNDPNSNKEYLSLEFNRGLARNVPKNIYDAFAAAGIATTERPRYDEEDED